MVNGGARHVDNGRGRPARRQPDGQFGLLASRRPRTYPPDRHVESSYPERQAGAHAHVGADRVAHGGYRDRQAPVAAADNPVELGRQPAGLNAGPLRMYGTPVATTSGERYGSTKDASQPGRASASSSRKAATGWVAARSPVLWAPDTLECLRPPRVTWASHGGLARPGWHCGRQPAGPPRAADADRGQTLRGRPLPPPLGIGTDDDTHCELAVPGHQRRHRHAGHP